ncbi:MAG TPA: non-ribosomal peptide synthetase, partial [Thermoanaerobaculia bacterium]|nr:non-ribosomal peptide synthetase [Thermoanaerobaculia bacterium]
MNPSLDTSSAPAPERELSLLDRLSALVARDPHHAAVEDQEGTLTLQDLWEQSGNLAFHLGSRQQRHELVAIRLARLRHILIAIIGVLRSGRAFVVIDGSDSQQQADAILHVSLAAILVHDDDRPEQHTGDGIRALSFGGLCEATPRVDLPAIEPEDLAFVVYTSGSTGSPKGVARNHRQAGLHLTDQIASTGAGRDDRFAVLLSPAFAGGLFRILSFLCSGAVLLPFAVREHHIGELRAWLDQQRITLLFLTPSLFRSLCSGPDAAPFSHVRLVLLGAEATHPADVALFRSHFPDGCRLHLNFASSEAGTITRYEVPSTGAVEFVPAGRPEKGKSIRIVDPSGNEVPAGSTGEIMVRGTTVADGYWNDPELTDQKFVDHGDGTRTYRTGDLGWFDTGELLYLAGRADDQVKIRGYRVEPAMIERALVEHPEIVDVAVVAHQDETGSARLVAWLVSGTPPRPGELRQFLLDRIPEWAVPSFFMPVEALPRGAAGKIDRGALAAREIPSSQEPTAAPDPLRARLAALFAKALGVARVGLDDDFFAMGGQSLAAAVLFSHIARELGIELPLAVLLEAPTVSRLADVIERQKWA